MTAPRYRLRFTTGVTLTAATYGGGTYGSGTYGQQATDPLSSLVYYLVPWPGGYLTDPSWIYRQGDVSPQFKASVRSHEGPLDLTGLGSAQLVLCKGPAPEDTWIYDLSVLADGGIDWLVRAWQPHDLNTPGNYRAGVVLTYGSGRRLSIPADDRLQFVVNPNTLIPSAIT